MISFGDPIVLKRRCFDSILLATCVLFKSFGLSWVVNSDAHPADRCGGLGSMNVMTHLKDGLYMGRQ